MQNKKNLKAIQPRILQNLLSPRALQNVLMERCKQAALNFGVELLEQEVEQLCGLRFAHKVENQYLRGGSDKTSIILGGAKYSFKRPRVRGNEGEVPLATLAQLKDQDIFDDEIRRRMMKGVSTRNYDDVIESFSEKLSTSKSTVSRAFVRASKKDLDSINEGDLSKYKFISLMIDGLEIQKRSLIVAIGITSECEKIPLGLIEGNTENAELVKDLLFGINERGFTLYTDRILVVLDGGKALKKAIQVVFGNRAVIQRCWLHKLRNLKQYIPENLHSQLLLRMKRLINLNKYEEAKKELAKFIIWLSEISDEAKNSMMECGEEIITVHRLNVTGDLRKSLSSTNIIESLIGAVRDRTKRVRNYRSSNDQIKRWTASAIIEHKKKMRRLKGFKLVNNLISALQKNELETEKKVA